MNYLYKVSDTRAIGERSRILTGFPFQKYRKPIYVTENGFAVKDEHFMNRDEACADRDRVEYFRGNMEAMLAAINEDGVDVKGYFGWSERTPSPSHFGRTLTASLGLLDNFEWADGYETRFGVTYVDYETQKRFPKDSGKFLAKVRRPIPSMSMS